MQVQAIPGQELVPGAWLIEQVGDIFHRGLALEAEFRMVWRACSAHIRM